VSGDLASRSAAVLSALVDCAKLTARGPLDLIGRGWLDRAAGSDCGRPVATSQKRFGRQPDHEWKPYQAPCYQKPSLILYAIGGKTVITYALKPYNGEINFVKSRERAPEHPGIGSRPGLDSWRRAKSRLGPEAASGWFQPSSRALPLCFWLLQGMKMRLSQ
jgi:hypothetical protein